MARYSVSPANKAGVNTANTVMWQLKSAASDRAYIREMGIFVVTAPTTAPSFIIARATALGTSSATVSPLLNDPGDGAVTAVLDTAWSSAPTFTTAGPYIRNAGLPVTAGSGVIWQFYDAPLVLNVSTGLVVANLNATGGTLGLFGLYITYDE